MWKVIVRNYSRTTPPSPACVEPLIRVSNNNIAYLGGGQKEAPKPRQLLSLPPFPAHPLPGKSSLHHSGHHAHVTAITWLKYYFDEIPDSLIQSHFNKGLVQIESSNSHKSLLGNDEQMKPLKKCTYRLSLIK